VSAAKQSSPDAGASRARRALAQLLSGTSIVHAISVAASLGIADLLERGPRTARSLATQTRTHEDSLFRVLRALGAAGVFAERRGRFALTPMSRLLRTGAPGSMRSVAALAGAPSRRAVFGLSGTVRTGKPAFEREFGRPFYEYLAVNAAERRLFMDGLADTWRTQGKAMLDRYDFAAARTIVDVGGGSGAMLEAILRANAAAHGVIVEAPAVAPDTRRRIRSAGLARRCDVIGADFFDALPRGGDVYVLAFVLHNWGDREAAAMLRNCRRAMAAESRLLVIESPLDGSPFAAIHDLEMLLYMRGGRERSLVEYRRLLESAGLTVQRVIETNTTASLIEAVPARAARAIRRGVDPRHPVRRTGGVRGTARRSR